MVRRSTVGAAMLGLASAAAAEPLAPSEGSAKAPIAGPEVANASESNDITLELGDPRHVQLVWSSNIGSVQANPADGTLVYRVAASTYPQIALIGAYDSAARNPLLHVMKLHALPTIEVDSEPKVAVTVEVAGRKFGPRATNTEGTAWIPVEVPPGVNTATTFATDAHGNVTTGELALNPPAFSRVLALCAPEESAVYVAQVEADGSATEVPDFSVHADGANVSSPSLVLPGVFRVNLNLPAHSRITQVDVIVSAAGFESQCALAMAERQGSASFTLSGNVVPVAPERRWFGGGQLGWLTNGYRVSGPSVGVRVHRAVWGDRSGLRVGASVSYTTSDESVLTTDDQELALSVRSWPLLLSAEYVLDWGTLVRPKAAADVGVAITRAEAVGATTYTDEAFVSPWFGLSLGAEWWYDRHQLDGTVGFAWASHANGAFIGNVAGLRTLLGYQYHW